MASPMSEIETTRSDSVMRRIVSASKLRPVQSTTVPAVLSSDHRLHCAPPCINGASANAATGGCSAYGARSSGEERGALPRVPLIAARKMSSPRHLTPLGMPVVPPV